MREIKFRAYSTVTGGFDYFALRELLTVESRLISGKAFDEDFTFEQFTGLKDVNGVEIYEGDILRCADDYMWMVRFDDNAAFTACDPKDPLDVVMLDDYIFEVIGNIHENPELLEAK